MIEAISLLRLPFIAHTDTGMCQDGHVLLRRKDTFELIMYKLQGDEFIQLWERGGSGESEISSLLDVFPGGSYALSIVSGDITTTVIQNSTGLRLVNKGHFGYPRAALSGWRFVYTKSGENRVYNAQDHKYQMSLKPCVKERKEIFDVKEFSSGFIVRSSRGMEDDILSLHDLKGKWISAP